MRPVEAADHHQALIASMDDQDVRLHQAGTLTSFVQSEAILVKGMEVAWEKAASIAASLVTNLESGLKMAETCWASTQMVEFAHIAAGEFEPEHDAIDLDNLPMDYGVIFLENSLILTDAGGLDFPVDAFAWRPLMGDDPGSRSIILYYLVNNRKHPMGKEYMESSRAPQSVIHAPYHLQMYSFVRDGARLHGIFHLTDEDKEKVAKSRPGVTMRVNKNRELVIEQGFDVAAEIKNATEAIPDQMDNPMTIWWSLMDLMMQELVQISSERPNRATRKRMERLNLKPVVTIIALRKKKYVGPTKETGTGRQLHYRHLVRGHRKWVNTLDGPKRVYVSHYWRGPEDAPLYVSHKVNALLR
jgi:hypothetical protein